MTYLKIDSTTNRPLDLCPSQTNLFTFNYHFPVMTTRQTVKNIRSVDLTPDPLLH